MNYNEIGRKIRHYRRQKGLSQEQLAEAVNISVTHMSHIETANTKLSLPVLVDIATVLQVSTDDLLAEHNADDTGYAALMAVVQGCSPQQLKIITEVAKAVVNTTGDIAKDI